MGFLTVLNYIAMAIGYIIIILAIAGVVWILIGLFKEKMQKKKWEEERLAKEKTEKILEEQKQQEKPVESVQTEETKPSLEPEKKEQTELKEEEKAVDEKGSLKMVD